MSARELSRGMLAPRTENPHPVFTDEWFAWKEANEGWRPYHVGTTPSGSRCREMPRCVPVEPDRWRCPACGKTFPTYVADVRSAKGAEYLAGVIGRT